MIYTVVWDQTALDDLAEIWMQATNRNAVSAASNRIDRELRVDAPQKGIPFGRQYLLIESPLIAAYIVDPGDCLVRILKLHRIGA